MPVIAPPLSVHVNDSMVTPPLPLIRADVSDSENPLPLTFTVWPTTLAGGVSVMLGTPRANAAAEVSPGPPLFPTAVMA